MFILKRFVEYPGATFIYADDNINITCFPTLKKAQKKQNQLLKKQSQDWSIKEIDNRATISNRFIWNGKNGIRKKKS